MTVDEDAASIRINAAAAGSTVAAGESVVLTENPEANGQLIIAVPALTTVQTELGAAEARLVTLKSADNNVP